MHKIVSSSIKRKHAFCATPKKIQWQNSTPEIAAFQLYINWSLSLYILIYIYKKSGGTVKIVHIIWITYIVRVCRRTVSGPLRVSGQGHFSTKQGKIRKGGSHTQERGTQTWRRMWWKTNLVNHTNWWCQVRVWKYLFQWGHLIKDFIYWETSGKGENQKPKYTKTQTWQSKRGANDKKQTLSVTLTDGLSRNYRHNFQEDQPGLCNW